MLMGVFLPWINVYPQEKSQSEHMRLQKLALIVCRPENWSGDVERAMPFLRALGQLSFVCWAPSPQHYILGLPNPE